MSKFLAPDGTPGPHYASARIVETKPTMFLRFIDGVLHQAWEEIEYEGTRAVERRVQYRPVPSEVTK